MIHYLIICRSLTRAQMTAKVLERYGISGIIMRVPMEISEDGCHYCVKVSEKRISAALVALKNAGMSPAKVFMLNNDGSSSEVRM